MNYEALSKEQLIDLIYRLENELEVVEENLKYSENEAKLLFEQIEDLTAQFIELQCKLRGRRY